MIVRGTVESDKRWLISWHVQKTKKVHVETDIGTGAQSLVNFHGHNIGALNQVCHARAGKECSAVVRGVQGEGGIRDGAVVHVKAACFDTVDVNNGSIVPEDVEVKEQISGSVCDHKRSAEICCDVLVVRIGSVADNGCFVTVTISKLCRSAQPTAVVECEPGPGGALVGAIIQIFPHRSAWEKHLSD